MAPIVDWKRDFQEIAIGKGRKISEGSALAVLSIGHAGNFVVEAAAILKGEGITISHYDMRFVVPLDYEIIDEAASKSDVLITVEDGVIEGGFGSAVAEYLSTTNKKIALIRLGVPNRFVEHGTQEELYHECGFDAEGICLTVRDLVRQETIN